MTTQEKVLKYSNKIADMAARKGICATSKKYGISNWAVYTAQALEGDYVPPATLATIRERNSLVAAQKGKHIRH